MDVASTLNVSRALKSPGLSLPFEADAQISEMEVLGDPVRFEDIAVKGEVVGSSETVGVEAVVTATVHSRCARCLEAVSLPISAEMQAVFARQPDPNDPDQYAFEGYTVDPSEAVKDALVLQLPMRFLCREDCRGLCPKCGVNLNTGSCSCREGEDDVNPFSVLRSIVENDEEV